MRGTPTHEVTLGEHTIPVYAQRHAYLSNRLGRFLDGFLERVGDLEPRDLVAALQSNSYELLSVLLPNLEKRVPEYEFRGYGSREAMDADDYDENLDKSPTVPEIRAAFEVASRVNGFDVLSHLWKVIDPSLLRGVINAQIAEAVSQTSPTSPSENGTSDLTSSGMTPPTSTPSED
jgi:hypothetical protein